MKKKAFLLALALSVSLLMATTASAYLVYMVEGNSALSSYPPDNYYAKIDVQYVNAKTVNIIATAGTGFKFWDGNAVNLNLNSNNGDLTLSNFLTNSSITMNDSSTYANNAVSIFGNFNLQIDLTTAGGTSLAPSQISFTIQNSLSTFSDSLTGILLNNDMTNLAAVHVFPDVNSANTGFASGDAVSAPVPIPAAAWLLGTGLIGLALIRRRTKK